MSAPIPRIAVDNHTPSQLRAPRRQRRRAAFSQADISCVLRAARQQGGWRVELERDSVIVRLGKGRRVRLPDDFGSVEFWAGYEAAAKGARPQRPEHPVGSFALAVAAYKKSQGWLALSAATQRQRANIFKHVQRSSAPQTARLETR